MCSVLEEKKIPINEAMKDRDLFGRIVSRATFMRWMFKGVGTPPTKLETVMLGGRRYVSRESILRFLNAINSSRQNSHTPTLSESQSQKKKRSAAARAKLEALMPALSSNSK